MHTMVEENPYAEMSKKVLGPLLENFKKLEPDERIVARICLCAVLAQGIQELATDVLNEGLSAATKGRT